MKCFQASRLGTTRPGWSNYPSQFHIILRGVCVVSGGGEVILAGHGGFFIPCTIPIRKFPSPIVVRSTQRRSCVPAGSFAGPWGMVPFLPQSWWFGASIKFPRIPHIFPLLILFFVPKGFRPNRYFRLFAKIPGFSTSANNSCGTPCLGSY